MGTGIEMSRHVIAVDPGLREMGVAVARDGEVVQALLVRNPIRRGRGPAAWRGMAEALADALVEGRSVSKVVGSTVIIEKMKVYTQGKAKEKGDIDPDNLLELAGVSGALVGGVLHDASEFIHIIPSVWKGQVPKDVHNNRIRAALPANVREQIDAYPKTLQHNVVDACGILLWHLRG